MGSYPNGGRRMKRRNTNIEELILIEPYNSCERQICACSPDDIPIRRYKHTNGRACGDFRRADFGCWRIFVGKLPERICDDDCFCTCHGEEE